jgi:DNA-binding response OmpR family regulator
MPTYSKGKVMIVDDDKELLELVSIILQTHGYETLMVNNGRNLIEKINEFKPKTILLDIQLAEMDGRLLCREIKEIEEHFNISIILVSANSHYAKTAKDYLCDDFMDKPFQLKALVAMVDKYSIAELSGVDHNKSIAYVSAINN